MTFSVVRLGNWQQDGAEFKWLVVDAYRAMLNLVTGRSIMREEYAREQIAAEEAYLAEITTMIRQ